MFKSPTLKDAKVWAREAKKILYWEQPIIPIYQNIIIGVWNGTEWKGIVGEVAGAPVVNSYSIMKAIRVKYIISSIASGFNFKLILITASLIAILTISLVVSKRKRLLKMDR